MSIRVDSIEDDGVAVLASSDELNAFVMDAEGNDSKGLQGLLGEDWAERRVALDISEADYIDSAAIGWLLLMHKSFKEAGGRLVIFGLTPGVKRVINLLRIEDVLNLSTDRDSALVRVRGGE